MDPALPAQLLAGDEDLSHLRGTAGFNASSHRFHHILHLAVSSGEQEKLAQVEQLGGARAGLLPLLCSLEEGGLLIWGVVAEGGCLGKSVPAVGLCSFWLERWGVVLELGSVGCSESQPCALTGPSPRPRAISNPASNSRVCTKIS